MSSPSRVNGGSDRGCQRQDPSTPSRQFNPPDLPNVQRFHEPWAFVDPQRLVWVNDPNLTSNELIEKFNLSLEEAWCVIETRNQRNNQKYDFRDQIPLRSEVIRKFFSIANFFVEPKKPYTQTYYLAVGDTLIEHDGRLLLK